MCTSFTGCKGFSFQGSQTDKQVNIFFTNKWDVVPNSAWTSYRYNRFAFLKLLTPELLAVPELKATKFRTETCDSITPALLGGPHFNLQVMDLIQIRPSKSLNIACL